MEITRSTIDQVKEDVQENKTIKPPLTAAAKLRELLAKKDSILVCPGVYDGLTARIALQAGFDCLYMVCMTETTRFLCLDIILGP